MDTKNLILDARAAVAEASYCPKKLTAIHAGIAGAAALVVALLHYLLGTGIGDTGGLGGIGTRAALETAQTVLQLAVSVLTPFWSLSFIALAIGFARRQEVGPRTLLTGLRRWAPALRLMLLEAVIVFGLLLAATQVGSFLYMMTPFADQLNELVQQVANSNDPEALTALLMSLDTEKLLRIFLGILPFMVIPALVVLIPLSYRLRLAEYILMDQPHMGAVFAIMLSFRLMKKNCLRLLKLDLRFWWFYGLEILVALLCYGDVLLPMLGVELGMHVVLASFLFYALALICQAGLYVWKKPLILTAYALFYDQLLPREETAEEV